MGVYVQYGCGLSCPDGWLNFDSSPTLWAQKLPLVGSLFKRGGVVFPEAVRFGDIVKGLPVAAGSADVVYASHVLEHLSYDDFWTALRNTFAVLKPGGVFRLIVPDLEQRARNYVAARDRRDADASSAFMKSTHLGAHRRPRGAMGMLRSAFGQAGHLWMWDEGSMRQALEATGFTDIRRCAFNDSEIEAFKAVEDHGRFLNSRETIDECAMEARKPQTTGSSAR